MFKEILLPVDLGNLETQEKAAGVAVEMAKAFGCRLHVMTVIPDFGNSFVASYFPADYQERAAEAAEEQLEAFVKTHVPEGVSAHRIVALGGIYDEITDVAKKVGIDLIVMASHHPQLSDYLISSNAVHVTRRTDCSVLVVHD